MPTETAATFQRFPAPYQTSLIPEKSQASWSFAQCIAPAGGKRAARIGAMGYGGDGGGYGSEGVGKGIAAVAGSGSSEIDAGQCVGNEDIVAIGRSDHCGRDCAPITARAAAIPGQAFGRKITGIPLATVCIDLAL